MGWIRRPTGTSGISVVALVTALIVAGLVVSGASASERGASASVLPIRLAQTLELERTGVAAPAGLAFAPRSKALYVLERPAARASSAETEVVSLAPFALASASERAGSARIAAAVADPINVAFDAKRSRLLLLGHARELLAVDVGANGELVGNGLSRRDAGRFGLRDPRGLTVDPASGTVFVLDAEQPRIVRIEPTADGGLERAQTSVIDLGRSGASSVRGLAFDPVTGNLQVGAGETLYELTTAGELVATRELAGVELVSPEGMVFAPSGDRTDDAGEQSLYVADSGGGSSGSAGQIVELSLEPLAAVGASKLTSTLVRITDTGSWDPPSPDPSGIAYLGGDRLILSDGEVEETVNGITHFRGANVWEFTLTGTVIRASNISKVPPTTAPMTDEPTGIAFNSLTGDAARYFVSEDGGKKVYTLNPGGDGLIGTSDDTWTFFRTNIAPNTNTDPEGVAYDAGGDRLFVADGTNAEIYEYTRAGFVVAQFDVERYGVLDPETVEFNAASGTLFILSNRQSGPIIVETTVTGDLLQTIDASAFAAAGGIKPAGVTLAPASNGSGEMRFYIVDRGIDNDADPNANDGKVFELTTGSAASGGDVIFADGFESGSFAAWSSSTTGGGDLSVTTAAARSGSFGMQARINDNTALFVTDNSPTSEPRYRVRFNLHLNSIPMAPKNSFVVFDASSPAGMVVARLTLRWSGSQYEIRTGTRNDGGAFTSSPWIGISGSAWSAIELDWRASTGPGANDGGLTIWVDSVQKSNVTAVDNDTLRVDRARLGAVSGLDTGTRGSLYLDAFESRRETFIGA